MADKSLLDTTANDQAEPSCPVGERRCSVIDQVMALRDEVSQLTQQARTDTLTGLFNFRHLRITLEQEMERTRRTNQSTALIMIDLDHFKQVNDNWGHELGNRALISTAGVIRNNIRSLDIACRYGGEEFTVILPSIDLMSATQVAERIRIAVEQTEIITEGKDIGLTASLGVDIYTANQVDSPEQFIQRADQCLYQAKHSGRNQVCHGRSDIRSASAVSKEERDLLVDFFSNDNNGKAADD